MSSQNSQLCKCPKCGNQINLIQTCNVHDKEYHLYRCLNCRRLFIENNIENEKEVFDLFLKTPQFLNEKYQYFIAYLINKGRFIYAKEYVEQYKTKFNTDVRLLMNEFLINLRCKNEKDLQFYIKNIKDFDLLDKIILGLEGDKREKMTRFFLVSVTNCANIFGENELLKCDKIFENILILFDEFQQFNIEIEAFAKVCVNRNFNDLARKYYGLLDKNVGEKNNNIDNSTLLNNKKQEDKIEQERDDQKSKIKEKSVENREKTQKNHEKTQKIEEKSQKDKIKKVKRIKSLDKEDGKTKKIVLGAFCAIIIIAIVIVGAFFLKGDFKPKNNLNNNSNFENNLNDNKDSILPVEGNYQIIADFSSNYLQEFHGKKEYGIHLGIDFSSDISKNVFAVEGGSILNIEESNGVYKITINIQKDNVYMIYDNLAKCNFSVGQAVNRGVNIGTYNGEYLHFEIIKNGIMINPHTFLNF